MTLTDRFDRACLAPAARRDAPERERSVPRPGGRAPQSSVKYDFGLVCERAPFEAMKSEWNALFARAGRPHQLFQAYDWLWHWANHYLDERTRLAIVVGRQDGRLVMVWPLIAMRAAGLTRLCWMGEPVSQYGDVLIEDGPARFDLLCQGWAYVKSLGADVIYLRKTREDAAVFPLLAHAGAMPIAVAAAPYVDLAGAPDYESSQQRRSAKKRARRRALLRGLQEAGTVAFELHEPGWAARDLVRHALAFKEKWLEARGVIAPVLQDPRFGRFLRDVVGGRAGTPEVSVSALSCNGRPAALEISLKCKKHRVAYLISYDMALAKHGIGILVAEYSIRTAHQQGFVRFDLLTPADPYKMEWANGLVEVRDWAVSLSRPGRFYVRVWLCFVRAWMRSAMKRLPAWLGRGLLGCYRWARAPGD